MSNSKSKTGNRAVSKEIVGRQKMTREGWILMGVTAAACLLPMLLGARLYDQIPAVVSTHIVGRDGRDDSLPRAVLAFGIPALLCVLNLLAHYQINTDPKRLYGPGLVRALCAWGFPVLSSVCCYVLILESAGQTAGLEVYTPLGVGMVLLMLGGRFLRCTPESLLALRLPWTRKSRENFAATHRFAAILWLAAGLAVLAVTTLTVTSTWATGAALLLVLAAPAVYSWQLDRKHTMR